MRKGERRRKEILETAASLFFSEGYDAVTLQDILDRLGCSKGSFYHHFESKLDVLAAVCQAQTREAIERFDAGRTGEPLSDLGFLLREACILRRGDEALAGGLAAMAERSEGPVLLHALRLATEDAFYPEFVRLATELSKADLASFSGEAALRVAFDGYLGGCALALREISRAETGAAQNARRLLQAACRQAETTLGLPYGCLNPPDFDETRLAAAAAPPP